MPVAIGIASFFYVTIPVNSEKQGTQNFVSPETVTGFFGVHTLLTSGDLSEPIHFHPFLIVIDKIDFCNDKKQLRKDGASKTAVYKANLEKA